MKKLQLSDFSVQVMNRIDLEEINGGEIVTDGRLYYAENWKATKYVAHQVGDFFRGIWDEL